MGRKDKKHKKSSKHKDRKEKAHKKDRKRKSEKEDAYRGSKKRRRHDSHSDSESDSQRTSGSIEDVKIGTKMELKRDLPSSPFKHPDNQDDASKKSINTEENVAKKFIGPQFPPPMQTTNQDIDKTTESDLLEKKNDKLKQQKGPERPPDEFLKAFHDMLDVPMIGPIPSEIEMEDNNVGNDVRAKEAIRVLKIIGGFAKGAFWDPFLVLGVKDGMSDSEIKKKYWKVSLLVHPDKCTHPKANEAFQAINTAYKKLGDSDARAMALEAKEDAALRKLAEEAAEKLQREQDWATVRAGGKLGPKGPKGPRVRESWMTDLPPERQKPHMPSQVNQTSFLKRGVFERGDTSGWTSTPFSNTGKIEDTKIREQLCNAPGDVTAQRTSVGLRNSQVPKKKSLVEQHMEKLKALKKEAKKKKKKDKEQGGGMLKEWRPFNREKDLEVQRDNAKDFSSVVRDAQGLHSKFQGGG